MKRVNCEMIIELAVIASIRHQQMIDLLGTDICFNSSNSCVINELRLLAVAFFKDTPSGHSGQGLSCDMYRILYLSELLRLTDLLL